MTRIDFYSLEPDSQGDRFILACRLVDRLYSRALRVLILCPEREEARHLDRLLWTFRQESFLPHGLVGNVDADLTPILISHDGSPEGEHQVLLNLSRTLPTAWERFARLCDLVDNDPGVLQAGRARFRAYREHGYKPAHHRIRL